MPFCSFDKDGALYDVTPIENMFLLEYLPTAPDGYLRVYLYARMLCVHPELGESLADMARALHMDEQTVFDAMTYWERQGLVRRLTDRPPTFAVLPVRGGDSVNPMDADYYEYRDFNANLQAIFGDNLLHPAQYEMASDWLNLLGFTQEAVLKMVEERLRRSRSRRPDPAKFFKKLNETAIVWADRGVRSADDVARALQTDGKVDHAANIVMKQLSMHRQPTQDELALVRKWVDEWQLSDEEILSGCAETTKIRNPNLSYLDSVLETRRRGGIDLHSGVKTLLRALGASGAPTPEQQKQYAAYLEQGFEPRTLELAAEQCARKNKHRFEDLDWMLKTFADRRMYSYEEAEAYLRSMSRLTEEVRALLKRCGSSYKPQMDDLMMYQSWQSSAPRELIEYAADCAKGRTFPLSYMDKILEKWKNAGIKSLPEAQMEHSARNAPNPVPDKVNPALNYQQHTYTQEDYNALYIDLDGGEGA